MTTYLVSISDGEDYKRIAIQAATAREAESLVVRANPWYQCLAVVESTR